MTLFDLHTFGPGSGDRVIARPRRAGELRRIWRWVRAHELPAQVVLVLMAVAVAYLALVFGLLVGAGIAPCVAAALPLGASPMRPAVERGNGPRLVGAANLCPIKRARRGPCAPQAQGAWRPRRSAFSSPVPKPRRSFFRR
jgi:hypothetical protein